MDSNNNTKNKFGLIGGIALLVFIIVFAVIFYNKNYDIKTESEEKSIEKFEEAKENVEKPKEEQQNTAAQLAPDFTVYDSNGNAVKLSEKVGKPVFINFWATWCGPCHREMPYFEEAYKKYGDRIEFMMINPADGINDTTESVTSFIEETGYTFPVYRDLNVDACIQYGIRSFPTSFLVNKDGYFIGGYEGTMSEELLNALIELLLS